MAKTIDSNAINLVADGLNSALRKELTDAILRDFDARVDEIREGIRAGLDTQIREKLHGLTVESVQKYADVLSFGEELRVRVSLNGEELKSG